MSLMIWGALATGSGGNKTLSSLCARSPARSASCAMVRLTPPSPPTPFSVKPKPSWIGGSSKVMISSRENPSEPSGSLVSSTPITLTATTSAIMTSSTPAYWPLSWSNEMNPPPLARPRSSCRPRPSGGLNANPRLSLSRLPGGAFCGTGSRSSSSPTRCTVAWTGPSVSPPLSATTRAAPELETVSPMSSWSRSSTSAIVTCSGMVVCILAWPLRLSPAWLDHLNAPDRLTCWVALPSICCRKPSPDPKSRYRVAPSVPSAACPAAPADTITSTPPAVPLTSIPAARPDTSSRVPPGSPNKIHGVAGWPAMASDASICAGPALTVRSTSPGLISAANTSLTWNEPETASVKGESTGGMAATDPLASGVIAKPTGAPPG